MVRKSTYLLLMCAEGHEHRVGREHQRHLIGELCPWRHKDGARSPMLRPRAITTEQLRALWKQEAS